MHLRIFTCLLLLLWPVMSFAADWGKVGDSSAPVNLEADQLDYDKVSGRYQARGNVLLTQGDLEVRSQSLWWNQQTGEMEAEGDVRFSSPDEQMSGRKVQYNLQSGVGQVDDGYVFLREPNLHVYGEQIDRLGKFDYRIQDGTFTTCDGENPSWKFGAEQLDVTLGGYARGKNAIFYLKDIPSFYIPYIIYPAKTDRESGLLVPRVGYSGKRGFQYSGAYYQVLGINQDATFNFDILSEMGIGTGLEYRYIFGRDNAGLARGYYIEVDQIDGEPVNEPRYALEWQHDGELPGKIRMVADALYVNEVDYFKDLGTAAGDYNRDIAESIFSLSRSWGKQSLVGQLKYTKDLDVEDPTTLQLLPRITFDAARQRIGESLFYFQLESEYTRFWREETTASKINGERLLLRPTLSADLQLFDVFEVLPTLAYTERYYWGLSDDSDSDAEGLLKFTTRVTTKVQRVFERPFGAVDKLRHSIEPEVLYVYVPELDQTHLPYFDTEDRIAEANRLEYALVQRFTARYDRDSGLADYRDLVYWRLSQQYDLRSDAEEQPFSAIRSQVQLWPTAWANFNLDTTFDIDRGRWSKISTDMVLRPQGENQLVGRYRKNRATEQEYASVALDTEILKPVYLHYEKRYDLAEGESLEDVIGVEYRQQCWSALLTFRDNNNDSSVLLSFTMKGIGEVGGIGGNLGGF